MTLLDKRVIDLRMPWTREEDAIGDTAITIAKETLAMSSLMRDRVRAMDGSNEGLWPGFVQVEALHGFLRDAYRDDDLVVQFSLRRNMLVSGNVWDAVFLISGPEVTSSRQLRRIEEAIRPYVLEQPHLDYMKIEYDESMGHIVIAMAATVGVIVEPMGAN